MKFCSTFSYCYIDLQAEFKSILGVKGVVAPHNTGVSTCSTSVTPSLKDWTGVYTTAVNNQGSCGSCWAFSTAEQIESDTMRMLGLTYTLSPEQLVQCVSTNWGCDGI